VTRVGGGWWVNWVPTAPGEGPTGPDPIADVSHHKIQIGEVFHIDDRVGLY
jgi:hypothetical protein